jgi:excisionase family DNA binding protein
MQVSQTLSRTISPRLYLSSTKPSSKGLGLTIPWDRDLTRAKLQHPLEGTDLLRFAVLDSSHSSQSYPQSSTPSSFALGRFICENLMYESNKSSKEVSWMTQLLTLEQVARQLSVSKRTVQRLVSLGRIETIHLSSGLVRVSEKAFERFIEKQQRTQRLAQGVKRG